MRDKSRVKGKVRDKFRAVIPHRGGAATTNNCKVNLRKPVRDRHHCLRIIPKGREETLLTEAERRLVELMADRLPEYRWLRPFIEPRPPRCTRFYLQVRTWAHRLRRRFLREAPLRAQPRRDSLTGDSAN